MLLVAAALSLLIGVVLGMLGGGGAILTLPILVYVVGVDPKTAIAMSLFVVGSTSVVGTAIHARAGLVRWKLGATFGAAAMAGAFAGGRIARFVPATALLLGFAAIMLVTAIAMLKGRAKEVDDDSRAPVIGRVLALGAIVGVVSGLVGAGGGFLIVPALILIGGLAMRDAVGTSLFVIALQSFAGFAGHLHHVALDWSLVAIVTSASVVGTVVGVFLAKKLSPAALRRGFAWFVLTMGVFMVGRQVSATAAAVVGAIALAVVVVVRPPRKGFASGSIRRHLEGE